ncbi:MAG: hypothetical protein WAV07_13095 [Candidatus Contendobacter sp.]
MKVGTWLTLIGILALMLAGCKSAPVNDVEWSWLTDVEGTPILTSTHNYTLDDVRDAIQQAGVSLGWQMRGVRPGLIIGTLTVRKHMAQVEIPYDRKSYSIVYRDSQNLNYDGVNIHRTYNGWIKRLNDAIKVQLSRL